MHKRWHQAETTALPISTESKETMKKNTTWGSLLRLNAWVLLACLGTTQLTANARSPSVTEIVSTTSNQPTRFTQCPHFFAQGKPPVVAPRPKLRELCYEAFAILHTLYNRRTSKTGIII